MALTELEGRITAAVRSVGPSVAAVETLRGGVHRGNPFLVPAEATAVVVDDSGLLLTNQHVVEGAREIRVHFSDGRVAAGAVVGGDPVTDVAVVRVEDRGLRGARLGDSESLQVGQVVLAVGNALGLPGSPTVSLGVVSALDRPLPGADFVFEGLIQTDAAINPGNSGGPLVDLDGAVVGINTAVMPFAQGVGFSLPIRAVQRIAAELRTRGRVVRPWIGTYLVDLRPDVAGPRGLAPNSGVLVADVIARSPAHQAGLRAGDVLDRVGRFEVRRVRELLESLARYPVGSDVEVGYRRRGMSLASSLPLRERPESLEAPSRR
ncbi:MAG TPA: trypsin-like peptidase domain-containing protein [Thermoplasmata archaeon]|nr:trypsin-like peptidase domain-containing protein [Thermoplasmata archaeon]